MIATFSLGRTSPTAGKLAKGFRLLWPVVQRFGVKVGAIRPNQRVNFVVYPNSVEQCRITKWAVQLTEKDRLKVDCLDCAVSESNLNDIIVIECKSFYFGNYSGTQPGRIAS